ncbi:MAG: helix-turn-helix domain-containing protein [Clostridia bacterium]
MNEQKDIIVKKRNFEKKKGEGLNSESHKITFGEKLQETLEDKKMSIPEFAKLIGRNEKAVQDYIDNKTKPRMKTMHKIEKTLDISFLGYYSDGDNINNAKSFGERLKEAMKYKGITIKRLASLTDMSESTISNYRNDITKPGIDIIKQFEKILNVSFEEYHPVLGENMTFGQELNLVLADKDIAIKEFADELDISKETLYAYIHAEGIPNIKIIHLMEEKLDVSFYKYYSKIIKGNTLGETLKYLLKYKGICKKKFAKSLHISKSTLYSYMENRSKPGIATIHQMGKILDYSFAEYY